MSSAAEEAAEKVCVNDADSNASPRPTTSRRIPEGCALVYAPILSSSSKNHHQHQYPSEWGIFTTIDRPKGSQLYFGDIVFQLTDPDLNDKSMRRFVDRFGWKAQETGGQFEGKHTTISLVSGLGMMARYHDSSDAGGNFNSTTTTHNMLPFVPHIDEGGLTRMDSAGAGAISHWHNYSWFAFQDLQAGDELVQRIKPRWKNQVTVDETANEDRSPPDLDAFAYCLDNLRPRKSKLTGAGRGAFATRHLSQGSIISPVPVIPLSKHSLTDTVTKRPQLLQNYVLGHSNSSVVLFPYAPMIHFINHAPSSGTSSSTIRANVVLKWSEQSQQRIANMTTVESLLLSDDSNKHPEQPPLMLELIATEPIALGEELYLDYGSNWKKAWYDHVKGWKPADQHYAPAYVLDDAVRLLRTPKELAQYPYDSNIEVACFYRYSQRDEFPTASSSSSAGDKETITAYKWKFTKGVYDLQTLRPCQVLQRKEDAKGRSTYAVRMFNRPGLDEDEIIPEENKQPHLVTHVPRNAIRFVDKVHTTDQHLEWAFRHEIGLPDDVFPEAWMDLN